MRRRFAVCAIAVIAPMALAACGGDDEKAGKETSLAVSETEQGAKLSLQGVPGSVPAGPVTITLTNSSKAGHDLTLIKVDGNHSAAEVIKVVTNDAPNQKIPAWLHAAGGVGEASAGKTVTATQVLQPGTYYALDDDSPDGENQKSFAERGAIQKFTVTGDKVKDDLPEQANVITAKEKGDDEFEFATDGLTASDELQFVNDTEELHHVIAFKPAAGKTAADIKKFLASDGPPTGPPPFDTSPDAGGATGVIDKDGKVNAQITFKPGKYVLVCFLTDRDGKGKPHFQEGMFKEVTVK